jgi:hypothetical protein
VIRVAPRETLKKEDQEILEAKRTKERLEDLSDELIPVNYATESFSKIIENGLNPIHLWYPMPATFPSAHAE